MKRLWVLIGLSGAVYASAVGSDVWRVGEYRKQVETCAEEAQQLDATLDDTKFRLAVKENLANDYVAGRRTFREVTEQFHELNTANEEVLEVFHDIYPQTDDREIAAHNAVDFIRSTVPNSSPARAGLMARLQADFHALFPQADAHMSE